MVEYIYFVKCPNCEDEHFDFFDEAKAYALGCLSKKPIITQVEVCRNDFGECTDSYDLGTKWSWEDMMSEFEPDDMVFSKDETFGISEGLDDFDDFDVGPQIDEFLFFDDDLTQIEDTNLWVAENLAGGDIVAACWTDSESSAYNLLTAAFRERTGKDAHDCYIYQAEAADVEYINDNPELLVESCERKPIPEGMTIEQLVEEMEENEDTVECALCQDLFDKSTCRKELNLGWCCSRCADDLVARGENPVFKSDNYWDFLDEAVQPSEKVDLHYDNLEVTLVGSKRDVDDWDEIDYSTDYTYSVDKTEIAETIWENFITEEDAVDVPGGLTALEDDDAWQKFIETHFDALFAKYEPQLLDYYAEQAAETFEDNYSYEEYEADCEADYYDSIYDPEF